MSTDIDVYQPAGQPDQYQARLVMTSEEAKALDDQVRACTRAVLREGVDYGTTPGTGDDTKTLKKPGAEKLLQWFGLAYTMHCLDIERDDEGRKQGATYRCTVVKRLGDGHTAEVATCEGYAGFDEAKFYKSAEQAQADAEAKERYWAAKDRRAANPNKWKFLGEYKAPWNTVIKMSQKRALVGAAIVATAAGGLFSQEEEEADDRAPVADDGSTWYEQALEAALTFDDKTAGDQLYVQADDAARTGLCNRRQKDHVQSRVRQRQAKLRNGPPVEVEDLARQAASDAGQPGDKRHKALVGAVQGEFKRLGFTDDDRADRLWAAGKLAGVQDLDSLNTLDHDELRGVARNLAKCKDRAALEELLVAWDGAGDGGA